MFENVVLAEIQYLTISRIKNQKSFIKISFKHIKFEF